MQSSLRTAVMILAIASGKGGTGKTTLSVNLARVIGTAVQLLDCDVEEPNDHLFLKGAAIGEEIVSIPVPIVDESLCDGCGECSRFCRYHAIVTLGRAPLVFPEMCHGCGGCMKVCPTGAIRETDRRTGTVVTLLSGEVTLIQGRLDVGAAMSPPVIRAVRERMLTGMPAILDSPPGTSCPVIAAIREADFVLLVTEPTPFGLNDLELAVMMTRELGLPFGVVVNRAGSGDERVQLYCRAEGIPLILEIPDDRRIAETCSRGGLIVESLPEYRELFLGLWAKVSDLSGGASA